MLFGRPDGTLLKNEAPVRAIMPYLMRGRNESIVFSETIFDVSRTLPWLKNFNRGRPPHEQGTLFHLFLWACARTLHERGGLNRFVSGGRLYRRNGVSISFAAKREMRDGAPFVTVKVEFPSGEEFADCVARLRQTISEGRGGRARPVDKEVSLVTKLPGPLIRLGVAITTLLDRANLMPASMIRNDPMYASLFAANIGSVGLDAVFHHLYEYGNVSLFAVMGRVEKAVFVGADEKPVVRDGIKVRWSFDERINDGLYCANSLKLVQAVVEDPAQFIG
jgi:hypothetical protein